MFETAAKERPIASRQPIMTDFDGREGSRSDRVEWLETVVDAARGSIRGFAAPATAVNIRLWVLSDELLREPNPIMAALWTGSAGRESS